jgi:class 3 adenylate cyclase
MPDPVLPQTRWAQADDCEIAYQVLGDSSLDLVFIPNSMSNVEVTWERPEHARLLKSLASFSRLILFDRRGTGLSSSPSVPVTSLEEWMDDAITVMDAAGSQKAAMIGGEAGGPMALLLAATFPDRVSDLVLINTCARFAWAADYPFGVPQAVIDDIALPAIQEHWGDGGTYAYSNRQVREDPALRSWYARMERFTMTPMNAVQAWRTNFALDVRDILQSVQAPTLIIHATKNPTYALEHAHYLVEKIANARLVEYEDDSHAGFLYEHQDFLLDEIQEFLTGVHHVPATDRVLATVLFTDIVDSTKRAAEMGDRRWRDLLEAHDAIVVEQVRRFRGRYVKSTGDGVLATFDGPARAIHCALAMTKAAGALGLEIRAGLHTGEIELVGEDIRGIAVHLGARVAAMAGPSQTLVSRTVTDLVAGSGIEFEDQGEYELKGVPGTWKLFAVKE